MGNNNPHVTVLMAVYNGEPFVSEAIESILGQTFTEFEFIIIEDGSADGTAHILAAYAEQDARIRLMYNKQNRGLIHALNKGLEQARGVYIARQDADDISKSDRLRKQVDYMEDHPDIGVLGSWYERITEDGCLKQVVQPPTTPSLIRWALLFECCLAHPTVMMRRTLSGNMIKYVPERLHAEDYDLWSRMSRETDLANLPEALVLYREGDHRVSVRHARHQKFISGTIMQDNIRHFLDADVPDIALEGLHHIMWGKSIKDRGLIEETKKLIYRIYQQYVSRTHLTSDEHRFIRTHVAHRMFGLSKSSYPVSFWKSLQLYGTALWWSPFFYSKTGVTIVWRYIRHFFS